jgi:hypothetical protein
MFRLLIDQSVKWLAAGWEFEALLSAGMTNFLCHLSVQKLTSAYGDSFARVKMPEHSPPTGRTNV